MCMLGFDVFCHGVCLLMFVFLLCFCCGFGEARVD